MSTKNVRTKINKESRIEFRCSKAFKLQLEEIAVQNSTTLSKLLESACTDLIKQHLPAHVLPCTENNTHLNEVDTLVLGLTEQGLSTRKVAAQLTELGYQKDGKDYTHNMVNTIIKNNRK